MKLTKIALALLAAIGAGCASIQSAPPLTLAELPNCFDAAYARDRGLFTIRNETGNPVNLQCLLTVGPRRGDSSPQQLAAGKYRTYLSNGGGGGGGGTIQATRTDGGGGGGGGGGAGAMETQSTVTLTEGVYKLTIGAGGPGGSVCKPGAGFGGGPGWLGSPSNMIRVATGEVVIGAPGADTYARPSRFENERSSGPRDGHGGSGYGQASGGQGAAAEIGSLPRVEATSGASTGASQRTMSGGAPGTMSVADNTPSGGGGGGGASVVAAGGHAGGESPRQSENRPERGSLGSGGGGGEGSSSECDPGARGGHGYIAFRQI